MGNDGLLKLERFECWLRGLPWASRCVVAIVATIVAHAVIAGMGDTLPLRVRTWDLRQEEKQD